MMGRHDEGWYLSKVWCCLICYWKGTCGNMKFIEEEDGPGLACPRCGGTSVHPANKEIIELPCYVGERGTLH
jgi:hypothetical protein